MDPEDRKAEIAALEIELHHLEKMLDRAIRNNERFAKAKKIFLEMKVISERIGEINKMSDLQQ
jgi:hypothetical protein